MVEWSTLETVAKFFGYASSILVLLLAVYGVDSWRREHPGKRRIELAEDTLALFYEAVDAIRHIRHRSRQGPSLLT
jgi:hypothetical protein